MRSASSAPAGRVILFTPKNRRTWRVYVDPVGVEHADAIKISVVVRFFCATVSTAREKLSFMVRIRVGIWKNLHLQMPRSFFAIHERYLLHYFGSKTILLKPFLTLLG